MKVNTINEAWEIAKELINNATLNSERTERAGYKVYSNNSGEWISDLETRLEVNMTNGNTVNIWIEEKEKYYTSEEAERAAKHINNIIKERTTKYTFAVSGDDYTAIEERRLYEELQRESFWAVHAASETVVKWCKNNGIEWGSIRIDPCTITYYKHGETGGHYCFDAYITDRITD